MTQLLVCIERDGSLGLTGLAALGTWLHCCHTHTRNHGSATVLRALDLLDPFATAGAGTAGTGAGAGAPGGGGAPLGRRGSDWHVSIHQGLLGGSSPGMSVRWA